MIEITIEDGKIPERLRKMALAVKEPRRPFADLGGHWQRRVKMSMPHLAPLQAGGSGKPPAVHTSEYVHSILYDVAPDGQSLTVGSSSIRARLLHKGGTIRARRVKMLAIPIAAESYGKRPRDFQGLRIMAVYHRGGQPKVLLGRDGLALFVLQPEATIRPHPHIEMLDEDWKYFEGALKRELDAEWENP